ncbi:MAG TPA: glycosyltransferase, partial [Verrucomicrobiae bacterium]|nr:glycosyltransferase [Verrucomicrobiae bacterium]
MSTRFSVLVPSFNREELLRETIDSVLSQSHKNYELIVIDDGSTDGTWDMLQSYGNRVRALRQSNRGPEVARNLGGAHATGEYLVLLDSDDLLLPHSLATYDQVIRTCDSPAMIIGAIEEFVHGRGLPTYSGSPDLIEAWKYSDYLSKEVGVFLSSSSIVIRKSTFDQGGGLRNSTPTTWQVDTFATVLRFGTCGPCAILKQPTTVAYRAHAGNTMLNVDAMIKSMLFLIKEERQGQFPGGRARRFARYACLGGMTQSWVRHALRAHRPWLACKLLVRGSPMLAAGAMKKLRSVFLQPAPAIRISGP